MMAYPSSFARLTINGSIYGSESFTFGLSIGPTGSSSGIFPSEQHVEAIAGHVATFWGANSISSGARLLYIKLNALDSNGQYISSGDTTLFEYSTNLSGNSSTPIAPQLALAVSLTTARRRGLAHAGRFYVPMPTAQLDNDGRFNGMAAQGFADSASTMIQAINDEVGAGWGVVVASKEGAGKFEQVTGTRVGRVLDTIRSRRTSLDENAYLVGPPTT